MTEAGPFQGMRPQHAEASGLRIDRAHCQLDSTGHIAVWPPEAEFISGTSRLNVEGKSFSSFLRGESAATIDLFLARGSSLESLLTFPGHWEGRWLDLSVAPFLTSDGKVLGYTVWMQTMVEQDASAPDRVDLFDATSCGGQSASLTADLLGEDGYRMLLNCAGDGIFLHARGGLILDVNLQACRNLGYSREELIGQMPMLYAARLNEKRLEDLRLGLDEGRSFSYETIHRRKNGEEFPVEVKVSGFSYGGNNYCVSIVRDCSERHSERLRLEESEERLRLALDTVKLGTWRFVLGSGFATLDRKCQELMGFSQSQVTTADLLARVHPEDRIAVRSSILNAAEAIGRHSSVGLEHRLILPDGTTRWVSVRALAHFEGEGPTRRPISLVGTTLDISKPKFSALSLRGQNSIFEAIAVGHPLDNVLEEIIALIEAQVPDAVCSILLASADGKQLHFASGPQIPRELQQVCEGLPIGPMVGACGSAAWHRQSVIVSDVATDPRFNVYHDLMSRYGLRCCWSVPIFGPSSDGDLATAPLLGTFAVYKTTTGIPDRQAQLALATGSRLASVAISTSRANQEIREAEERYSMISQITRSVTFAITVNAAGQWHFDWSRPSFGLLSGYTHEEVNQIGWKALIHPDDHGRIELMMLQTRAGNVGRAEVRYRTKDGQLLYIQTHAKLLRNDSETNSFTIIGGLLDISELKAVEQALRRSEERFQLALAGANDGLWDWNLQTDEVFYSPRWMQMLGYTADELPANVETWILLLHPDESDRIQFEVQNFIRSRLAKFEIEYRLRHKDGTYRHILSRGQLARDEGGQPTRLVGTHQDLTERKRAESVLRRNESFLRRAQKIASLGRWELDLHRKVLEVCEETQRQFSLKSRTLTLKDVRSLVHSSDRQSVRESLVRRNAASTFELEFRVYVNGASRWIVVKASGELTSESGANRIWGILQDISDRKQLEEQFRQAQKLEAFGQLAGGVAHDFNNLLTVINGSADMLLEALTPDDPTFSGITVIRDAGERAATLTRQLLVLSRQQFTEPSIVDVNVVVSKAESMLRRLIGEHIHVETFLQDPLPALKMGQGQLDQVLLNLAVNARDAMERGGVLRIETRLIKQHELPSQLKNICESPCVRIAVSDTGCGMTEEVKERIFEPFFSTKGIGKGTGLGLATVYGIVQQNHGVVTVNSHKDCGTTFDLYFPALMTAAKAPVNEVQTKPQRGCHETILLVEDEELVRQLTTRVLFSYGYHVIEAQSGEDAILTATKHAGEIHLLLTDVVMPGINGTELALQLRKLFPEIRVLFMSGYTDDDVLRRGVFTQQDAFLQKPFTPSSLVRRIQELIQTSTSPNAQSK